MVFCTVNIDTLNIGEYAGQVIHKKCKYAYKYLCKIQMMIVNSFMRPNQGISGVGINTAENLVNVEIRDNDEADNLIEKINDFLKERGIEQDAVKFQKVNWINRLC